MLDPRYKDHYLDAEIRQRAREMIQAALDAENPRGDGEAPSAGDRSERRKKDWSLHQMSGMHHRCLICSVEFCKKVPQIIIIRWLF